MSNIVFLAERWPFAWRSTSRPPHNLVKNKYLLTMWRSPPPGSKGKFRRPPLRNMEGWLDLFYFPGGFGIPRSRRLKSPRLLLCPKKTTRQPELHSVLVLASFVFAMLFAGKIGNFVMRSNNPIDACANTHKPSRSFWSWPRRKVARELPCRPERDRVGRKFVLFRPVEARPRFGRRGTLELTWPTCPCATSASARAPPLPSECRAGMRWAMAPSLPPPARAERTRNAPQFGLETPSVRKSMRA